MQDAHPPFRMMALGSIFLASCIVSFSWLLQGKDKVIMLARMQRHDQPHRIAALRKEQNASLAKAMAAHGKTQMTPADHALLLSKHKERVCSWPADKYAIQPFPAFHKTKALDTAIIRRNVPRKLIWGMIFDCEEMMLEIKLNEIGHIIDHFILVEGAYSLQNTPRAQCFPAILASNEHIAGWESKITYIFDTEPIQSFQYWEAEVYYRDLIGLRGLSRIPFRLEEEDLIIVSDVDEVLSDMFLEGLKWHEGFPTLIEVRLLWSYYSFVWVNPNLWTARLVASVKELSELGQNRTNALRFNLFGHSATKRVWRPSEIVGWHCSWCMPLEQFVSKMQHFAHSELNRAQFKNLQYIAEMRRNGLWFPDQKPNGCIQNQEQLPSYVSHHKDRFQLLLQ